MPLTLTDAIEASHRALAAIIRGDLEPFVALCSDADDITVGNPFGPFAVGREAVRAAGSRAASNYSDGEVVGFDLIATHATEALACVVEVERFSARLSHAPEPASVALRVTSLYRHEADGWRLVHRHADPINEIRPADQWPTRSRRDIAAGEIGSLDSRLAIEQPALMDRQRYKALIDALVAECLTGQGQIASTRVQLGTWNASASADHLADQHDLNVLLAQLSADDRSTLASMVNGEFVAGVHAALRVLEEAQVLPSDLAFEGSAFADFAGRLGGWAWPA